MAWRVGADPGVSQFRLVPHNLTELRDDSPDFEQPLSADDL